jgi:hypothetical protein
MLESLNIDLSWAPPVLAFLSVLGIVAGMIRWLVKHYLDELKAEFKPNGGGSMKDAINRLESENQKIHVKIDKIEENNERTSKNISDKVDRLYTTIIKVLGDKN